jgi:hypothetical protein
MATPLSACRLRRSLPALICALPAVPALAHRVTVQPAVLAVAPGEVVQFEAQVLDAQDQVLPQAQVVWRCPQARAVEGFPGRFIMPASSELLHIQVRATLLEQPEVWDTAQVFVIPPLPSPFRFECKLGPAVPDSKHAPAEAGPEAPAFMQIPGLASLVKAYAGTSFSPALPFLDWESRHRFGPGGTPDASIQNVLQDLGRSRLEGRHLFGYGLRNTLNLAPAAKAAASLLTWETAGGLGRADATGGSVQGLEFRDRLWGCVLETLNPSPKDGKGWESRMFDLDVRVRGVFPLAGNPAAEPEHRDGPGITARFVRPLGLAMVNLEDQALLLAVDAGSHAVRVLGFSHPVTTLAGVPAQSGHRDGPGHQALFRNPSFIAARPCLFYNRWLRISTFPVVVADTGNQAIRILEMDGTVRTLAGSPGVAGHADSPDPGKARFHAPLGVAMDPEGNVFVADSGNCVIRRIDGKGVVTTLAGSPGEAGSLDGAGSEARFRKLKGLVWADGLLYATDGHSVRRITPEGQVRTVLGDVDKPGNRDIPLGADPLQPCLQDPWGLTSPHTGCLLVVDRLNGVVRSLDHHADLWTSATVAGDGAKAPIRWGLLADGLSGPLDDSYASLGQPVGIVCGPGANDAILSTGTALGLLSNVHLVGPKLQALSLPEGPIRAGAPLQLAPTFRVDFPGDTYPIFNFPENLQVLWRAHLLDPHTGECVATARGESLWSAHTGAFLQNPVLDIPAQARGPMLLRLRTCTGSGFSEEATCKVAIQE